MTEHLHPDTGIVHDHGDGDLHRHRHDPYAGYRRLAEAVLIAHQRRDDSNCLCGRLRLGDSWAEHVAEILDVAGALRDRPAPRSDDEPDLLDRAAVRFRHERDAALEREAGCRYRARKAGDLIRRVLADLYADTDPSREPLEAAAALLEHGEDPDP